MVLAQRISIVLVWLTFWAKISSAFSPLQVRPMAIGAVSTTRHQAFLDKRVQGADADSSKIIRDDSSLIKPFWEQQQVSESKVKRGTSEKGMVGPSGLRRKEEIYTPAGDETKSGLNTEKLLLPGAALLLTAGIGAAASMGVTLQDAVSGVEHFFQDPQATLQNVVDAVEAMGPAGVVYFGMFYLLAEVLCVPATPLTMSAGYLFGLGQGSAVVLTTATIAASIAFFVGKTFLRSWVEDILEENPKFAKLDKAIGEQGFKLLLLVRLSPIFPFALSNYVYGASAISFPAYFWGTLLGFAPGSIAFVYTGMVGKELMYGGDESQPWYIYAAGFGAILGFLKLATDVSSGILESIDDDSDETVSSP